MHRVFIDGQAGTTGLQIHQRLSVRTDVELLETAARDRKDARAKQAVIEQADLVILCLPDEAARAAVQCKNGNVRFIDASSAHRVNPAWCYGLPELAAGQRQAIASARLVSNPGCYPTGFLIAVRPLIEGNLLRADALIGISALSGYSGGGRRLIERYEARSQAMPAARPYALRLQHKHLPEMTRYSGLENTPAFLPLVGHFYQGMLVSTPIFRQQLAPGVTVRDVHRLLEGRYESEPCIRVMPPNPEGSTEDGFLDPEAANGTDRLELFVFGNAERMLLIARLDNLGKGAAGAAVHNLNLMLQAPELEGLTL